MRHPMPLPESRRTLPWNQVADDLEAMQLHSTSASSARSCSTSNRAAASTTSNAYSFFLEEEEVCEDGPGTIPDYAEEECSLDAAYSEDSLN